ncbi:hypothetical protein [Streptomyces sp. CoH17]|uniref:hypothetical protein n=1 Tax=Streptomyces sp. CoH17 TaxID=2992806 RepID=UPI00226F47A9|nr:hypothetical protein [Streptomyces sp. CoH17]
MRNSLLNKKFAFHDRRVPRTALVVAEFEHPDTEAPMVTYFVKSELRGEEEPWFTTYHRKGFTELFPTEV